MCSNQHQNTAFNHSKFQTSIVVDRFSFLPSTHSLLSLHEGEAVCPHLNSDLKEIIKTLRCVVGIRQPALSIPRHLRNLPQSASLPSPNRSLTAMGVARSAHTVRQGKRPASLTPYVYAVAADQHGGGVWIVLHGVGHAVFEVLLVGGIFDDRHFQGVEIGQRGFHSAYAHAFDHLSVP